MTPAIHRMRATLWLGLAIACPPCFAQYGGLVRGIGDFALQGVVGRAALAPSGTALAHISQHAGAVMPTDSARNHVRDGLLAGAASRVPTVQEAPAPGQGEEVVPPQAYRNAFGLVQLNQAAGQGNASSNVFVLRPPSGTRF